MTDPTGATFRFGDRVTFPNYSEWGLGVIVRVDPNLPESYLVIFENLKDCDGRAICNGHSLRHAAPSPTPAQVVAGSLWRDKYETALNEYLEARDAAQPPVVEPSKRIDLAIAMVRLDALLSEVREIDLPALVEAAEWAMGYVDSDYNFGDDMQPYAKHAATIRATIENPGAE